MSETTVSEANNGSNSQPSNISEVTIRLAGNSQDGIQSIGGFLARLAGRSEREVMTMMTIPSTISGGPSIFQVRLGSGEVLSPGDKADVLFAFYQPSYDNHVKNLTKGGVLVYDSDHVEPCEEWLTEYRHIAIAISSLTVEAIGGTAGLLEGNPGQVWTQFIGIMATVVYCGVATAIILKVIGAIVGLRVDEDVEVEGLDLNLHGEVIQ